MAGGPKRPAVTSARSTGCLIGVTVDVVHPQFRRRLTLPSDVPTTVAPLAEVVFAVVSIVPHVVMPPHARMAPGVGA